MEMLEKLGYSRFPFRVVPDEESSKIWAGDAELEKTIKRLKHKYMNTIPSTIQPLWGWYGAGKTHTLLYLNYLLSSDNDKAVSVYVEFSPDFSTFLDLYKLIMSKLFKQLVMKCLIHLT